MIPFFGYNPFLATKNNFEEISLALFKSQINFNSIYRQYVKNIIGKTYIPSSLGKIPFLPVTLFKQFDILAKFPGNRKNNPDKIFESSNTTGAKPSRHLVNDISIYNESIERTFLLSFSPGRYDICAFLPGYAERGNSSLVYMVNHLMKKFGSPWSGFFTDQFPEVFRPGHTAHKQKKGLIIFGVSHALLGFAERFPHNLPGNTIMIETGGMKGKREEITREELHIELKKNFGLRYIYSEYGMTELLSHAYTAEEGKFIPPPWMKVMISDVQDPFFFLRPGQAGRINVIDLLNLHSCSFIQTDDLGCVFPDGTFEIIGRIDSSEIRGCNLMYSEI